MNTPRAPLFDVFGTVVDWRGRLEVDWVAYPEAWRAGYRSAMDRLHRLILDEILARFAIRELTEAETDELNRTWYRLGLKTKCIIATLSSGNMALLTEMAKHAGLPWDCILSAQPFSCNKPDPQTYLGAGTLPGTRPDENLMVAAHEDDLAAARANGLRTAFVRPPREFGRRTGYDLPGDTGFDLVAEDFVHHAGQLGA